MKSINPATEVAGPDYPDDSDARVEAKLRAAAEAFEDWRRLDVAGRAGKLHAAGGVFRGRRDALARLMAEEMGKPVTAGESEVDKCADCCDYFADHAAEFLATRSLPSDAARSYVRFDPLGPVLAIMPWNFPLWQVFRFAAPALMAGQRRRPQARPQRARVRRGDRRTSSATPASRRASSPSLRVPTTPPPSGSSPTRLVRAVTLTGSERPAAPWRRRRAGR